MKLSTMMYIVLANQKNGWYLGFTHKSNCYESRIEKCAQNLKEFAFFFKTENDAKAFITEYFKHNEVKETNKKYFKVVATTDYESETAPEYNILVYGIPCYFSLSAWSKWRKNPGKWSTQNYLQTAKNMI